MNFLKLIFWLIIFSVSFLQLKCKNESPITPRETPKSDAIKLSLLDTLPTEIWMTLTVNNTPQKVVLQRDGFSFFQGFITQKETVIVDEDLIPKNHYSYKAFIISDSIQSDSSKPLQCITMDSTSHNIVWTKTIFGDGKSALNGVAIINDTLAYAVGEIYLLEGNDFSEAYNLAKWDGKAWKLQRITVPFRGNSIVPKIKGIYAFSDSQIWLAASLPIYGDGTNWKLHDVRLMPGLESLSVQKCWGSSPDDMYFVGFNGSIGHYFKGEWSRIESGTRTTIQDIWGGFDPTTGEQYSICIAHASFSNDIPKVIQIKNNITTDLPEDGLTISREAIWFIPERKYYLVGGKVFTKRFKDAHTPWTNHSSETTTRYYAESIKGNSANNVFVTGSFGVVSHYNGSTWKMYLETYFNGSCYSIDVKNNVVIAVGSTGGKAYIFLGKQMF